MLPRFKQRLVIVVAMIVGAVMWTSVSGWLTASDGSSGISILSARVGVVWATLAVALAGLAALGLGVVASVMGNPLAGVFAVSGGLCVLAIQGGSIDGWLMRTSLPGGYGGLMVEMLIWQVGVCVMLYMIQLNRSPMRAKWPALAFDDHLGVDLHLRFPEAQSLVGGVICAVTGAAVCGLMIRTTDSSQVIGSLLIAFGVGGLVAGLVFPQANPVGVLFSPALVAMVAYLYVILFYSDGHAVLGALYSKTMPGVTVALPIHYASAGVAGCAAGLGMAQGFVAAKVRAVGV